MDEIGLLLHTSIQCALQNGQPLFIKGPSHCNSALSGVLEITAPPTTTIAEELIVLYGNQWDQ